MIRVSDVRISINSENHDIKKAVARKIKVRPEEILSYKIYKKAIDARNKNDIIFCYAVDVKLLNEKNFENLKIEEKDNYPKIERKRKSNMRPVVVGAGPAGLFAAYVLAKEGLNPVVIEQGKTVEERKRDVEEFWNSGKLNPLSNVQFGEGGAGTFSDGKLTTLINDPYCNIVIDAFIKCGAPKEIKYLAKPHLGTDNLIKIIGNLREEIKSLGADFYFNEKVINFEQRDNKVTKVITSLGNEFETDTVLFAIGHSARDTFKMLLSNNVEMQPKAFSVGVRIEHLRTEIDKSQYGKFAGHKLLGAAEYKLVNHGSNERSAYTFCMCPGGYVVASTSEEGHVVTNGMSNFKRDAENSNSAVLVGVGPNDFEGEDVLRGMYFQEELEKKAFDMAGKNYNAPVQRAVDYIDNKETTSLGKVKPSYKPGYTFVDFNKLFPNFINDTLKEGLNAFNKRIKGFLSNDAILTGVETRSSSPVRIKRDERFNANIEGIYPVGEGAGYAGGIMSAAVDGIKAAIKVLENE